MPGRSGRDARPPLAVGSPYASNGVSHMSTNDQLNVSTTDNRTNDSSIQFAKPAGQ
jgi:hypothetical protein